MNQIGSKRRQVKVRHAAWDSVEPRANGRDRQLECPYRDRAQYERHNGAGNAAGKQAAGEDYDDGASRQRGGFERNGVKVKRQRFHAQPEHAGNFLQLETEEVLDLGAGNEDGNSVRKADDDGSRNVLNRRPHAGEPHDHQNESRHHRAHEEAIDTVESDNAGDDDDEGSGGATDLGGRSAERGDEKAGDDRAVDSSLRREARSDGKGHGQRQGDQAYGDSGDQVAEEFIRVVIAQAEDGLGKPALLRKCEFHGNLQLSQVEVGRHSPRKGNGENVSLERGNVCSAQVGRGRAPSPREQFLKPVPEVLVVDVVVILHFGRFYERAQQTRAPVGRCFFEIGVAALYVLAHQL